MSDDSRPVIPGITPETIDAPAPGQPDRPDVEVWLHLVEEDEDSDATYNGDNATIERLCLYILALEARLADAQFEATKWRNIAQGDIGMKSAYEHEALEHGATRERLEAAEARVKELEAALAPARQQARAEALEEQYRVANRALLDCIAAIRAAKEVPGA